MRILSIGNFGIGWDGSICDEEHVAGALEGLGHEVYRWQREASIAPDGPFDFVLIAQWDGYPEDLISNLRRDYDCPLVYWAFDYQRDGQAWHEQLIAGADLYLSKRITDSRYPNWQWFCQDFAPDFLDRVESIEKPFDVVFTGSYLPWGTERTELLRAVDEKYDLHIFSVTPDQWSEQGFKNVNGPVMDHDLPKLVAQTKINLSIDLYNEAGYWSDRNAQIMACGGYVLFRYVPMSESIFGNGVNYFYNTQDCLDKIQDALGDIVKRGFVASLGYAQASYCNRLKASGRAYDLINVVKSIL